jgi:ubiquinone/menaquinone biosynthesis C-methylase UbiE
MRLKRILEPELMDTVDAAMAYDAMDHAQVNRVFVEDLLRAAGDLISVSDATDVLDLGTGTAQIPIELCRQSGAVRVLAVDAATSMLDSAIANIDIAGLRDRICLACVDAKQLPYDDGRFPIVMSNSIVHHIPEPLLVVREAERVTTSGGLLFFRDLLRPQDESAVQQLIEQYAGSEDDAQQQMFADSLRAALTLEEIRALVGQLGYAGDSVQQTSDRHWTWVGRKGELVSR